MQTNRNRPKEANNRNRPLVNVLSLSIALALGVLMAPLVLDGLTPVDSGATALAGNGPGGGGSGGGGSGGGGGGGGNNGTGNGAGNGGGKPSKGGLYGDQVYLLRDADGVPVLYTEAATPDTEAFSCLQPLAIGRFLYDGTWHEWTVEDGVTLPLVANTDGLVLPEGEMKTFCATTETVLGTMRAMTRLRDRDRLHRLLGDPNGYALRPQAEDDAEPDSCDVIPECADNVTEVELGRLSVLRAPDKVLDRQRDEAIRTIDRYYPEVELDHGGRLVMNDATFDSPLINLAFMREFLNWGVLADNGREVWAPPEFFDTQYTPMLAAAFGIGAGDDKLGAGIDPEVVIRSYFTLGIPATTTFMDLIDTSGADDPSGVLFPYYLDFGDFEYNREEVFPGGVCWDELIGGSYVRRAKSVLDWVFDGDNYEGTGLAAFAQAADDARHVMVAVHDSLVYHIDPVFNDDFGSNLANQVYCPPLNP